MIYLKARLAEGRQLQANSKPIRDWSVGLCGDWSVYLAGLFTGEGTLGLHKNGGGIAPKLAMTLRIDDLPLLDEVYCRTGVGQVYISRDQRSAAWMVRDAIELTHIVEVFDHAPLRGRKAREYAIWRRAVELYSCTSRPRRIIQTTMRSLRAELDAVRAYSGPDDVS